MRWEKINDICVFAYSTDMEALFVTQSLLLGDDTDSFCQQVYGEEQIHKWKTKYRFLFETTDVANALDPFGIMELCADIDLETMTLDGLKEIALSHDQVKLLYDRFEFGQIEGVTEKMIADALVDDDAFQLFYEKIQTQCPNYLGVYALFHQLKRYIEDFFSLTKEVQNEKFFQEIKKHEAKVEEMRQEITIGLKEMEPLEFSQKQLGKIFYNRGAYRRYIFMVSVFMPYRAMRFFIPDAAFEEAKYKQQLLIMNLRPKKVTQDQTIAALKAISDKTRYQILALLSKSGPIHGRDICKQLSLAPSTISHHMDMLKECGLITEEQVKTSKYYGINRSRVEEIFEEMRKDIKLSQ